MKLLLLMHLKFSLYNVIIARNESTIVSEMWFTLAYAQAKAALTMVMNLHDFQYYLILMKPSSLASRR